MTRDEIIAELCLIDGMYPHKKLPTRFVTVGGPADKYGDEELALLVEFTRARQEMYRERCGNSKLDWHDNFISIDRDMDWSRPRWGRKRRSWSEGSFYKPSLPEAISAFWGDRYREEMTGELCLLGTGEIVQIVQRIPYDRDNRTGDYRCLRLVDGEDVEISQHKVGVVAIYAASMDALGDRMRMAMRHRIEGRAASVGTDAELEAAAAAVTPSNDAADLTAMWASRFLEWSERHEERAAAAAA